MLSVPNAEQIILIPQPSDDPNDPLVSHILFNHCSNYKLLILSYSYGRCGKEKLLLWPSLSMPSSSRPVLARYFHLLHLCCLRSYTFHWEKLLN